MTMIFKIVINILCYLGQNLEISRESIFGIKYVCTYDSKETYVLKVATYSRICIVFMFNGGSSSSYTIQPIDTKIGMNNPYYYT